MVIIDATIGITGLTGSSSTRAGCKREPITDIARNEITSERDESLSSESDIDSYSGSSTIEKVCFVILE